MDSTTNFYSKYADCRKKFLSYSDKLGLSITSHRYTDRQGPEGEELACDVARLGPVDAQKVIFVGSGTHGLEGPVGSNIQSAWLLNNAKQFVMENCAIVLVHAINPYGFAYCRRTEENNIDPNRNFYHYNSPPPENKGYRKLHNIFCPQTWDENTETRILSELQQYEDLHGRQAMLDALGAGQFEYPDGLFYGGTHEAWTTKTLRSIFNEYSHARNIVFLDFHSGLGSYSEPVFLCFHEANSPGRQLACKWFGTELINTEGSLDGRSNYTGLIYTGLESLLPDSVHTHCCVEMGTEHPEAVFMALLKEHWLHHHSDKFAAENSNMLNSVIETFAPSSIDWQKKIVRQGTDIIQTAVNGLLSV